MTVEEKLEEWLVPRYSPGPDPPKLPEPVLSMWRESDDRLYASTDVAIYEIGANGEYRVVRTRHPDWRSCCEEPDSAAAGEVRARLGD